MSAIPLADWTDGAADSTASTPQARPSSARADRGNRYDRQILAALDVVIPQVKPPPAYGLAMGVLAVCVVLLPLAYLALVAFLGYLAVWHVYQTFASFAHGPYFVFHLPMAFLGGLLLLFLVKPVFFRKREKERDVLALTPHDEPLLFAFVQRLCAATGSKAPSRIEVDCEPNASARLRRGLGSLFGGDLVLRVGLPLAAGLSVRQFAGVLGHEFGHFNQRSGMTGSYLIRRLTAFFAQVVFQRDRMDEKLARLRRSPSALSRGFYYLAVVLIEPARGVLWLMLLAGELLTCGVLRRMEYDADRVEAHVAGVKDFVRTSRLLMFLHLAASRARHDLARAYEQQRLADDFPRLVVANAKQLAEHRKDVFKLLEEEKTGWLDTHPSHNDRVRNVQQTGAAGLVACDTPAKHLFADFEGLCRRATNAFYQAAVGDLDGVKLVPTRELAEERAGQRAAFKVLRRFFRNHVVATRPVFPGPDAHLPADDVEATAKALRFVREKMLLAAADAGPGVERYEEAMGVLPSARAHLQLCGLFPHVPKAAGIRARADAEIRRHEPLRAGAVQQLTGFEQLARQRLSLALRLLHRDEIAAKIGGGADVAASRQSVSYLFGVCQWLQTCQPAVNRLGELAVTVRARCWGYDDDNPYPPLVRDILNATGEAVAQLGKLQTDLASVAYPFAHGTEGVSIGAALLPKLPDPQDPVETHGCILSVLDRFYDLTFRSLSSLTEWAEWVEAAVGLPALSDPPDTDGKDDRQAEAERKEAARDTRRYWLAYGGRATAGLALLVGLIVLSASPPELPAMPWESGKYRPETRVRYRPASFHVSKQTYSPPPLPTFYDPRSGQRTAFRPDAFPEPTYRPGYAAPQTPGLPQVPGYPQPGNPYGNPYGNPRPGSTVSPYSPQPSPYAPTPYSPSNPSNGRNTPGSGSSPGGYTPGRSYSPGGGGYSPGNGYGGGGGGGPGRP